MKGLTVLVLVSYCNVYVWGMAQPSSFLPKAVEDYYWRNYYGLVPTDAVIGGVDLSGNTTYVGQFSIIADDNLHTIPATIRIGHTCAVATYMGGIVNSGDQSNTKILCSAYLYRYKWFSRYSALPANCRLVIGGYEDNTPMYVGRSVEGLLRQLGKLFADNNHVQKLIVPSEKGETLHENYEVLAHCV